MSKSFFTLVDELESLVGKLNILVSGSDNETVEINGINKDSISKAIKDNFSAIKAMVQGRMPFETKAELDASGAPSTDVLAEVWNDSIENNGLYGWTGADWGKSSYDLSEIFKNDIETIKIKTEKSLLKSSSILDITPDDSNISWALVDEDGYAAILVDKKGIPHFPSLEINADFTAESGFVWGVCDEDERVALGIDKNGKAFLNRQCEDNYKDNNETLPYDLVWAVLDDEKKLSFGVNSKGKLITSEFINDKERLEIISKDGELHVYDYYGRKLTSSGDCFNPFWISADVFKFISDRFNGELVSFFQDRNYPTAVPSSNEMHFFMSAGQSLSVGGSDQSLGILLNEPKYPDWCFKFNTDVRGRMWSEHIESDFYTLTPLHEVIHGGYANTHATAFSNMVFDNIKNHPQERKPILFSCHGAGGASYNEIKKDGVFDLNKPNAGEPTGIYGRGIEQVENAVRLAKKFKQSLIVPALLLTHGEDDAYNENYLSHLQQLTSDYEVDIMLQTQQSSPPKFLLDQVGSRKDSPAALHQHKFCTLKSNAYLSLSKYLLNWLYSDSSQSHLSPEGYCLMGEYHAKAWNEISKTGSWRPLEPNSASLSVRTVTLDMHVPCPPLVVDLETLPIAPNYGLQYFDSNGEVEIETVEVIENKIIVTLLTEPVGAGKIVNGYSSSIAHENGVIYPLSNIRDSESITSDVTGKELHNWLVIFEIEVN